MNVIVFKLSKYELYESNIKLYFLKLIYKNLRTNLTFAKQLKYYEDFASACFIIEAEFPFSLPIKV